MIVRDGGLGIRRVSSLALPAFVASAASTLSLQDDILAGCVNLFATRPFAAKGFQTIAPY